MCILAAPPSSTRTPTYSIADVTAATSGQWIERNGDARTDQGHVLRYTLRVNNIGTLTTNTLTTPIHPDPAGPDPAGC